MFVAQGGYFFVLKLRIKTTRTAKSIIKDNASYVFMASPPFGWIGLNLNHFLSELSLDALMHSCVKNYIMYSFKIQHN